MSTSTIMALGSGALTAASTAGAMSGDNITMWVTTILNAVILISNTALAIYRAWRDRDKDTSTNVPTISNKEEDDNEKGSNS